MEAGSSQAATTIQSSVLELPRKERKPRHKLKKGKTREGDGTAVFTHSEVAAQPDVTLNKVFTVEEAPAWAWASLTDTTVSNWPPVFTNDSRYFFLIAGSSVKIYATATGKVVSTLSSCSRRASSSSQFADGHTDDITAAFVNPCNAFQLMTASLDGRIKVWDYLEAILLSTIEVGEPITHMCAHAQVRDHVFVATNSQRIRKKSDATKEQSKVYKVSLRPSRATADIPVHKPAEILRVGKMRTTTGLAISPSGAWLVATGGPKAYVCSTASLGSGFTKFVSNDTLTCLAFHPSEEYFATGDQKGQIRLWYCLNLEQATSRSQGEKRAQSTTLHWHAHAVSSIAFTANGSYLLSGGEEAVLVIWQLHTGKREYVPRVGAPIISVAVTSPQSSEEEYLLVLSDGTLSFVGSSSLRVSRSISRIKHDSNYWSSGPAPLAIHAQSSTIILPSSHPSSLLVYAPLTSTLLAELEVSPSNRVSRKDKKPIEPSRVAVVVVSDDGEWLATIDGRERSEDFERETYMKIWRWDQTSSSWNLNSRIDRPHGAHRVNALTFCSQGDRPFLTSTGYDGNVKIWSIRTVSNKKGEKEVFWACRSTFAYRSEIPTEVVCSPDGSLLVVAHGRDVVVYQLLNNALRLVLTCPEIKKVSRIAFVGDDGRYLVVADNKVIVTWDLIAVTVRWRQTFSARIDHIIPHPKKDAFIVMCRGMHLPTILQKFTVASAIPLSRHSLPFSLRKVVWFPYDASSSDFTLVGITQKWESMTFGDHVYLREEEGLSAKGISTNNVSSQKSLLQDIFGATAFQDFGARPPVSSLPTREIATTGPLKTGNPLDAPAHLLPSLHTLFQPLIESFLRKREPQALESQEDEHGEEMDVHMDDPSKSSLKSSTARLLRDEEMYEFVELFKQQTFSSATTSEVSTFHLNGNGISKIANGVHDHMVPSSTLPVSTPINGKNHPPKVPEHAQQSSPTLVGKKRKQSVV